MFPSLPGFTTAALTAPVIATLNHLLAQEPWASRQLALHAGKLACFDAGAFALRLQVGADGLFEPAAAGAAPSVTVRVKLADLPLMAQQRERAFSYVKVEGDADFANTISQLSKTLRWDAEHDIERLLGPLAARRLVSGARAVAAQAAAGRRKLAENVAEYLLEEQPALVRPAAVEQFSADVARLRDDVERIGKRIDKLLRQAPARDRA